MTRQIVVATGNPRKLEELRRVVEAADLDVQILGLSDFPSYPEPEETERTFEGNAMLKAQAAARHTGIEAIADDSGITIEELNDMPGVRSARWAGPACDDTANLELLLAQLDGVAQPRRAGQFVCALAHVTPGGKRRVFRGEMSGHVAPFRRGDNGFGYDPIFIPEGQGRTTAEMSAEEKDAISHRGQAVRAFVEWLKEG
ncbi:MAG: RdgB/HAM1 family non-canonical purine NTP pyrophosphatase [Propionibacteriaceae bacterium]|nr:RdgB/HAM1 family non-canonical purine NTP pyrophosphatase [Propionibacteriaceae bacterium]